MVVRSKTRCAHVDRTGAAIVAGGALHHRHRIVKPDYESVPFEPVSEETREIAATAPHFQNPLLAAEM